MRGIGSLHPTEGIPVPSDAVQTMLIASSSGQAMDWPAGAPGGLVRLTGLTTTGAQLNFNVNLESTKAAAPSSGNSSAGSTGFQTPVLGEAMFQIPGGSTGWSVASLSSGYVMAELWKKGGGG